MLDGNNQGPRDQIDDLIDAMSALRINHDEQSPSFARGAEVDRRIWPPKGRPTDEDEGERSSANDATISRRHGHVPRRRQRRRASPHAEQNHVQQQQLQVAVVESLRYNEPPSIELLDESDHRSKPLTSDSADSGRGTEPHGYLTRPPPVRVAEHDVELAEDFVDLAADGSGASEYGSAKSYSPTSNELSDSADVASSQSCAVQTMLVAATDRRTTPAISSPHPQSPRCVAEQSHLSRFTIPCPAEASVGNQLPRCREHPFSTEPCEDHEDSRNSPKSGSADSGRGTAAEDSSLAKRSRASEDVEGVAATSDSEHSEATRCTPANRDYYCSDLAPETIDGTSNTSNNGIENVQNDSPRKPATQQQPDINNNCPSKDVRCEEDDGPKTASATNAAPSPLLVRETCSFGESPLTARNWSANAYSWYDGIVLRIGGPALRAERSSGRRLRATVKLTWQAEVLRRTLRRALSDRSCRLESLTPDTAQCRDRLAFVNIHASSPCKGAIPGYQWARIRCKEPDRQGSRREVVAYLVDHGFSKKVLASQTHVCPTWLAALPMATAEVSVPQRACVKAGQCVLLRVVGPPDQDGLVPIVCKEPTNGQYIN